MKVLVNTLCIIGLAAAIPACKRDPNETKLTYMPDMADAPTSKPQLSFLEPPPGSVAQNAILYPPDDKLDAWETLFHNPFTGHPNEDAYRVEGATLFLNNCSPCHGEHADGESAIKDKFPPVPSLLSEVNRNRSDGFFFHKITVGGAIMPSRAEHTFPPERWKIILHLRHLQKMASNQGVEGSNHEAQ